MNQFAIKAKAKEIYLKGESLNKSVLDTMKILSGIVGSTLGPGGNVVLLERVGLSPLITKDGVTVASHCAFRDATQHVISEAAKEAAMRTNVEAGDGTTTAIVLAEAITRYGLEFLGKRPDKSPQEVCRELDAVMEKITTRLQKKARKVTKNSDLHKVALVSANFDETIADAVVEAIDKVGNEGTIITEEGSSRHTLVEMQEGFPVRKGLHALGPGQEIFINDPQSQECVLDNPLVLIYNGDLLDASALGIFLERCFEVMRSENKIHPLLLVAHKFSPQTLRLCAMNFASGRALIVPMESIQTAQANSRHHFMHDLAAYVGADVLDPINHTLEQSGVDSLGGCDKIKIGRYQSVFLGPFEEAKTGIQERVEVLRGHKEGAESEYDVEITKERIGNLLGGVATIFVGGSSDLEIKEKKHRIEDAICATRSAIEQGVLPGGGTALLCLADVIDHDEHLPESKWILSQALQVPFARIMANAGESDATTKAIGQEIELGQKNGVPTQIWDALHHRMAKPFQAGILDPVKVTVSALRNGYSIAQMLFCLGGAIVIPRDLAEERSGELQAQAMAAQMQGA